MPLPLEFQYLALVGKTAENLEQPDPDREGVVSSLFGIAEAVSENPVLSKSAKERIRRKIREAIVWIEAGKDL